MGSFRALCWIVFVTAASVICVWIVVGPWKPQGTVVPAIIFLLFATGVFGAYWMIYQSIRYESRRAKLTVLALFPFSFIWYYFDRYRKRDLHGHSPGIRGAK